MQKITLISLKFLFIITLMLSCLTRMSFSYELNKNIVYYDGFIEGYLYKEIEDWSIICEVKNNDIKIIALSNTSNLKFELFKTKCTMDYCEYAGVIPGDFLEKLKNKDDFMIGVGNKKNEKNIGIMIEMNGFPEMFQALSKNEIKN